MSGEVGFDQRFLKNEAYADDANLAARQAIYRYEVEQFDFPGWALEQVPWTGGEVVVDVGCGNGLYLKRLARAARARSLCGLDLSTGMLRSVQRRWPADAPVPPLVNADAEGLPFADAAADVVLAMHMLYHVPDIPQAVAELRRVLRPGGTLLAAANAAGGLRELYRLREDALSAVAGRPVEPWRWFARFNLDNGVSMLGVAFDHVEVRRLERELRIPDPEPVVAFLDSRALPSGAVPADVEWEDVVAEMRRRAAARIAEAGCFRVTARMGILVCR